MLSLSSLYSWLYKKNLRFIHRTDDVILYLNASHIAHLDPVLYCAVYHLVSMLSETKKSIWLFSILDFVCNEVVNSSIYLCYIKRVFKLTIQIHGQMDDVYCGVWNISGVICLLADYGWFNVFQFNHNIVFIPLQSTAVPRTHTTVTFFTMIMNHRNTEDMWWAQWVNTVRM